MNKISILVALHKPYEVPADAGFLPVHLGKSISSVQLPFQGDDIGENISHLNPHFCELTGLYWLWKNKKADIFGLVHYRRFFKSKSSKLNFLGHDICNSDELAKFMKDFDIVLPRPRNYFIETIEQHYRNAHHEEDLKVLKEVVLKLYPSYEKSFEKVMTSRKASLYNMFVMKSEHFNSYCPWLFEILFEVEKKIPYKDYDLYQSRVFGFMAERLLNIWALQNIHPQKIKYVSIINIEGENLIKKGTLMVFRKVKKEFLRKKQLNQ